MFAGEQDSNPKWNSVLQVRCCVITWLGPIIFYLEQWVPWIMSRFFWLTHWELINHEGSVEPENMRKPLQLKDESCSLVYEKMGGELQNSRPAPPPLLFILPYPLAHTVLFAMCSNHITLIMSGGKLSAVDSVVYASCRTGIFMIKCWGKPRIIGVAWVCNKGCWLEDLLCMVALMQGEVGKLVDSNCINIAC